MRGTLLAPLLALFVITIPAYADVTQLELEKSFYTNAEKFKFIGTQEEKEIVHIVIRDSSGKLKNLLSDPSPDQGRFATTPTDKVSKIFGVSGIYNVTAFVDRQKESDGFTISINYDGKKITDIPKYVLELESVPDVRIDEKKTVSFTVGVIKDADGITYSLKDSPEGASIDPDTGKFVWTPSDSQGDPSGTRYAFDIVATKGEMTDKEAITIIVNEPAPPLIVKKAEPKLVIPVPFADVAKGLQSYVERYDSEPEFKKWFDTSYPEYNSIYHALGLEEPKELAVPAGFVEGDPQGYVDRYDSEPEFKKWFDDNYSQYDSIYHAVGLEEPKELAVPAGFVEGDPRGYVDRYDSEPEFKKWFDDNYSQYDSIYHAVGLEEPKMAKPAPKANFGVCGEGTDLVGDTCVALNQARGGGCLIATAAYGTEMAPQVQFLREIRDGTVMGTSSGATFMAGFNQIYYSFSPVIADWQRESPAFQGAVRAFITPMISTLSIMEQADSELEVLGLGISVIMLNLGMYVAAPALVAYQARIYV